MARIHPDDITNFLCALFIDESGDFRMGLVDADGHIQVDTLTTALPADAATATKQDDMITLLNTIAALTDALDSVGVDELDVNVETSALPTNAASAVKQNTMITALQKIDDLQDALNSIGADMVNTYSQGGVRLTGQATEANQNTIISRMQDQLFSFKNTYRERVMNNNAAAGDNDVDGSVVPPGEIWIVTNALAGDYSSACDRIEFMIYDGATEYTLSTEVSPGVNEPVQWVGEVYMVEGDKLRTSFAGCTSGDILYTIPVGYKMSLD